MSFQIFVLPHRSKDTAPRSLLTIDMIALPSYMVEYYTFYTIWGVNGAIDGGLSLGEQGPDIGYCYQNPLEGSHFGGSPSFGDSFLEQLIFFFVKEEEKE